MAHIPKLGCKNKGCGPQTHRNEMNNEVQFSLLDFYKHIRIEITLNTEVSQSNQYT